MASPFQWAKVLSGEPLFGICQRQDAGDHVDTGTVTWNRPNASHAQEMELAARLRERGRLIAASAPQLAHTLEAYASRIEAESGGEEALVELDRYAQYYKGLIDAVVPGVDTAGWSGFVHAVRALTRRSVRQPAGRGEKSRGHPPAQRNPCPPRKDVCLVTRRVHLASILLALTRLRGGSVSRR